MLALPNYARALLFVFLAVWFSQGAHAASLGKLIMPGPVSQAHAKIEGECSQCHDITNREHQNALCLTCHKDIAEDIRIKNRYHGRIRQAATSQCRGCHTEHLGRDADITRLSQTGFNHSLTNFALQGAHVSLSCESCHKSFERGVYTTSLKSPNERGSPPLTPPDVPYRQTPQTCIGCHNRQDAHREALGADCEACHDEKSWRPARFDHDKTAFPLTNKHIELACVACHPGQHYKGVPTACVGCHAPDDVHKGNQGKDCNNCHTTADWATQKFDHSSATGFALLGRHAHIGCASCHRSGDLHAAIPKDCSGCHTADDRHESRLGPACGECHGNDLWHVANFEHAKVGFPLLGPHAKTNCHACHTAPLKDQKLGTSCVSCHRADSPHGASMADACETCHAVTQWTDVTFDHDLTSYPLLGLHVTATCGQCHLTQHFKETARDCNTCHARDDVHNGALAKECGTCHTPNGWKLWDFDHAARTRFPLTGAHATVACAECHLQPQNIIKPAMLCGSCHAANDVHATRFGQECQQCHSTATFKRPRTNN